MSKKILHISKLKDDDSFDIVVDNGYFEILKIGFIYAVNSNYYYTRNTYFYKIYHEDKTITTI